MDCLIKNGLLITSNSRVATSIGIHDGLIAGLYEPGLEPSADEVIDASGLAILPGVIDMHSHHREGSEPGFEYKDTIYTSTQQCAAGGVTTSVAMPNVTPPPNSLALLKKQFALYERDAVVDWNFNPAPTIADEIPRMAEQGIAAFKIFMVVDTGRSYPHMPGIGVHDHGRILEIMQACAKVNVPLMVHPHNQALMDVIEKGFWERQQRDALAYAKAYAAHDGVIWETAIATLLRLQAAAGCHLHVLHTQTSGSVDLIRRAKAAGQRVTCEINPWALFLGCDWSAIQRLGSYALSYWVPEKNVPSLWQGLNDGTIDIVATDHAPHTREEKEIGWTDGWKAHTGTPSLQFYLSLLLTDVNAGKISLERAAYITATAPAKAVDLYPRKGAIQVGADADIVLVDLARRYTISDADVLSKCGWTPYAGREVVGIPVSTILRGSFVFEDGIVTGLPGAGRQATPVASI
jgi:dihydroorotase (multifunctional complex type)